MNRAYMQLVGHRDIIGKPVRTAHYERMQRSDVKYRFVIDNSTLVS